MKEHISMISTIMAINIRHDIYNYVIRNLFLESYNFYQDEERDGVDYIFDITDREDVRNTDLEVGEVHDLYNNFIHNKTTKYFLCGCNYPTPLQLEDDDALIRILNGNIDDVVRHILQHPSVCESHYELYQRYFAKFCYE